jgi:DNA-binding FadR family transcriptional regulator
MAKAKSKTGVRVARDIVQSIYDKGLVPGDRYLSEPDALAEHGVSRATYREATRFLEFQGVVFTKAGPGGGTVVARPDWRNLASTFALLMQFSGTSLAQVMAARRLLEPAMVEESVRNVSPQQIERMRACLITARDRVADIEGFLHAYRAFWYEVADASGSPVTAELWKALRAVHDSGGWVPNEVYRVHVLGRVEELLLALETGDADRARRIVEALDGEFAERLARDYPQRTGKTVSWTDIDGIME